jgi:hypothetical protein
MKRGHCIGLVIGALIALAMGASAEQGIFTTVAGTTYSRSADLPPLRMSFSDLQSLINSANSLITAANGKDGTRERIEVGKGQDHIEVVGNPPNLDASRLPDKLNSVYYTAEAIPNTNSYGTDDDAPVSRIEISFHDFNRSLVVKGTSPDEVDATFSALKDRTIKYSSVIGGGYCTWSYCNVFNHDFDGLFVSYDYLGIG